MNRASGTRPLLVFAAVALPFLSPLAPGPSPQVFSLLLSWLSCAALMALGMRIGIQPVAKGWLVAAVVSSVIALCQYFGIADLFSPWMNAGSAGEAYANLRQRNQFATLTNIGVAALLWWLSDIWQRGGGYMTRATSLAASVALTLLVTANAASASRIGIFQLLLIVLFVSLWRSPFRSKLITTALFGLVLYAVAAVALPFLLEHYLQISGQNVFTRLVREEGCSSRQLLWTNVLHLVGQKPWAGWGWGELDYAHYTTLYQGGRFCDILDNAHNLPLQLAVELGLPVALLVCTGIVWAMLRAAPWRAVNPDHRLAWTVLAIIALHSMVEYPLWYGPFQMAVGLSIFLLWRMNRTANVGESSGEQSVLRTVAIRWTIALAIFATVAFAGWDYHRISQLYFPVEERSERYLDDTMNKVKGSWLFRDQVRFAELTTTPLTRANAAHIATLASDLLHYSPERRVIEPLIESLTLLRRDDEALWHMARYRAAFPDEFSAWTQTYRQPVQPSR